jgi:pyridoxamine 5'-phosphate oxidase
MKDLSDYRKSYDRDALLETNVPISPFSLFENWFQLADAHANIEEANAMTLTTVAEDNTPLARVVLLKKITQKGFRFFSNYQSQKGRAIAHNPNVCLSFFWAPLERQVIVKGHCELLSPKESEAYFKSRPEGSQIGAIVSPQSQVIPNREFLEDRLSEFDQINLQKPEYWGGYEVIPSSFEFWQGRQNRLHDRLRYSKSEEDHWTIERLAP